MKVSFEQRERVVIAGLLYIAREGAISNADKPMRRRIQRIIKKFSGDANYTKVKEDDLHELYKMTETVMLETSFELTDGEIPKISPEDYQTCENIKSKLEQILGIEPEIMDADVLSEVMNEES